MVEDPCPSPHACLASPRFEPHAGAGSGKRSRREITSAACSAIGTCVQCRGADNKVIFSRR